MILGDEYNVLERLDLPSLPVGDQTLATGGMIALAAIVLGTLLAAMLGGKVGERYHRASTAPASSTDATRFPAGRITWRPAG